LSIPRLISIISASNREVADKFDLNLNISAAKSTETEMISTVATSGRLSDNNRLQGDSCFEEVREGFKVGIRRLMQY
jgi:hypothetical protein